MIPTILTCILIAWAATYDPAAEAIARLLDRMCPDDDGKEA